MVDLNFTKIIDKLTEIHTEMPDLKFGEVIQCAIDSDKRLNNVNFNNLSSKIILSALIKYYNKNHNARLKK